MQDKWEEIIKGIKKIKNENIYLKNENKRLEFLLDEVITENRIYKDVYYKQKAKENEDYWG